MKVKYFSFQILLIAAFAFSLIHSANAGNEGNSLENPSKATLSSSSPSDNSKKQFNENAMQAGSVEAENLKRVRVGNSSANKEPSEEDCARIQAQREMERRALQNPGAYNGPSPDLRISPEEEICLERARQGQKESEREHLDALRCSSRGYITRLAEVNALVARACERYQERLRRCDSIDVNVSWWYILLGPTEVAAARSRLEAERSNCYWEATGSQGVLCDADTLPERCDSYYRNTTDLIIEAGDVELNQIMQADRAVCSEILAYTNACPNSPMSEEDLRLLGQCRSCGYIAGQN